MEQWFSLFAKVASPKRIEILERIDVGYNALIYLVSVDGEQFAVKIYSERFNGTQAGSTESRNISRARKLIPDAVPEVILYSKHTENAFDREILVMERAAGVPLDGELFGPHVLDELTDLLMRLHHSGPELLRKGNEMERLHACGEVVMRFLGAREVLPKERVSKHLNALEDYYCQNRDAFLHGGSVNHGDIWWDNILVDDNKIMIVDWLDACTGDYCRDLAQLKIGTLDELFDPPDSQERFERVLRAYKVGFKDGTLLDRMVFYLPLMFLEESFYLPFEFFPWEIKFREDAGRFEARLVDYFERSERSFRAGSAATR